MAEVAVAVNSVPEEWLYDDRMLVTIVDVLQKTAEKMRRKKG